MEELRKGKVYEYIDESKWNNLHKEAFKETYDHIKEFSEQANLINIKDFNFRQLSSTMERDNYIHKVLCSPPGHGKTSALELHIKKELTQNKSLKRGFLLVFLNEDNMNTFVDEIKIFCEANFIDQSILAVTERNYLNLMNVFESYQILCITQQRFRDLSYDFKETRDFYKYYLQSPHIYWGGNNRKPSKKDRRLFERTVIVDEIPIFFDESVFDMGSKDNMLDWYDVCIDNTLDDIIPSKMKDSVRKKLMNLFTQALYAEKIPTVKLINPVKDMPDEKDIRFVLENLNTSGITPTYIARKNWFEKLLDKEGTGVLLKSTSKSKIICSKFIDYHKSFGNILILDGTSDLTTKVYEHGKYELIKVHNYNNYARRLTINWKDINTTSSKRTDRNSNIKEQISDDIIMIRKTGTNILPIPNLSDKDYYIESGAITEEQYQQFFKGREFAGDTLALNLHNLTGRNGLFEYELALPNLPILHPQHYRLQAVALYGTDIDLRLVSELDNKERTRHTAKWFVNDQVQELFEQSQKAVLSQIIHRTRIRNLNSTEGTQIYMYHNQAHVNTYLKTIFNLPDENVIESKLYRANKFRNRTREWAEMIQSHLKSMPNTSVTVSKSGGGAKFKQWIKDNWETHADTILQIFNEYDIKVEIKGKGGYKYFTYINNGIFEDIM